MKFLLEKKSMTFNGFERSKRIYLFIIESYTKYKKKNAHTNTK